MTIGAFDSFFSDIICTLSAKGKKTSLCSLSGAFYV